MATSEQDDVGHHGLVSYSNDHMLSNQAAGSSSSLASHHLPVFLFYCKRACTLLNIPSLKLLLAAEQIIGMVLMYTFRQFERHWLLCELLSCTHLTQKLQGDPRSSGPSSLSPRP
eukprot:768305-Hanusia_phi.AAC.5